VARILAVLIGIVLIFIGVAGFVPTFTPDGKLFNYFTPSALHNIIHIITGVIAIMAATKESTARLYFQVVGIIYIAAAVWGFWKGGDLYIMQVTLADNIFHVVFGVIALLIGFGKRSEEG